MKDYGTLKRGYYDALNGGSRVRLARYRRNLESSLKTIRACRTPEQAEQFIASAGYVSPLRHRGAWLGDAVHGALFTDSDYVALPASIADGFRDIGDSHDIVRMDHTGWFKDADMSETICGHVWQLPARNGEPVYLAGYREPDSGYVILEVNGKRFATYDDKEDAARAADGLAERVADEEREYNERWHAAHDADTEADDAKQEMRDIRKRLRRVAATVRVLRNAHEDALAVAHLEDIQDMRDEHKTLLNTYIEKRATVARYAREGITI